MARARSGGTASGEAIIGRSTHVRGRITGEGDLVVDGIVEGDITLDIAAPRVDESGDDAEAQIRLAGPDGR